MNREIAVPSFISLSEPIGDVLGKMSRAGVRLVELHGDAPGCHIDLTDSEAVDALAKVVERLPLKVHSVHCAFSQPDEETWDISQPDDTKRAKAVRNRTKVVESAARLNARHVVIHLGVRNRGKDYLSRGRESVEELAQTARKVGLRIAVENLPPNHLGGSLPEIAWVLEGLDPAVVGFCLDTGHALLGKQGPCDYIRAFGDRMLGIHWHGNDCKEDTHICPGADGTEWRGFLDALDEVGYTLPVTVEAVPPDGVSLEEAVRELRSALQESCEPRLS